MNYLIAIFAIAMALLTACKEPKSPEVIKAEREYALLHIPSQDAESRIYCGLRKKGSQFTTRANYRCWRYRMYELRRIDRQYNKIEFDYFYFKITNSDSVMRSQMIDHGESAASIDAYFESIH